MAYVSNQVCDPDYGFRPVANDKLTPCFTSLVGLLLDVFLLTAILYRLFSHIIPVLRERRLTAKLVAAVHSNRIRSTTNYTYAYTYTYVFCLCMIV
jgi:hypothetical protein